MIATILLGLWAALVLARGTPIGDALHRWLVAVPAARLARVRRETVVTLLVLVAIFAGAVWLFGEEARMLGMAGPEIAGMLSAIEVTAYVDALVAAAAAASAVPWKAVRTLAARRIARARAARPVRVRRPEQPAANDDEHRRALAAA